MKSTWQVVLAGEGGQGLIVAGILLSEAASLFEGKNAAQTQSYGIATRGGFTKAEVVISPEEIIFPGVEEPDVVLALTPEAYELYARSLPPEAVLFYDTSLINPTEMPADVAAATADAPAGAAANVTATAANAAATGAAPAAADTAPAGAAVAASGANADAAGRARIFGFPFTGVACELGRVGVTNLVALGAIVAKTGLVKAESLEKTISHRFTGRAAELNRQAYERGLVMAGKG